ncbi:hypothetical protein OSTOST_05583 [Ostertagia ostertagi]
MDTPVTHILKSGKRPRVISPDGPVTSPELVDVLKQVNESKAVPECVKKLLLSISSQLSAIIQENVTLRERLESYKSLEKENEVLRERIRSYEQNVASQYGGSQSHLPKLSSVLSCTDFKCNTAWRGFDPFLASKYTIEPPQVALHGASLKRRTQSIMDAQIATTKRLLTRYGNKLEQAIRKFTEEGLEKLHAVQGDDSQRVNKENLRQLEETMGAT